MERLFAKMDRLFEKYRFELGCTAAAWNIFFFGNIGLWAIHYHSPTLQAFGLPLAIGFFILAAISITALWVGASGIENVFARLGLFFGQIVLGYGLFLAIHLAYWDWAGFSF